MTPTSRYFLPFCYTPLICIANISSFSKAPSSVQETPRFFYKAQLHACLFLAASHESYSPGCKPLESIRRILVREVPQMLHSRLLSYHLVSLWSLWLRASQTEIRKPFLLRHLIAAQAQQKASRGPRLPKPRLPVKRVSWETCGHDFWVEIQMRFTSIRLSFSSTI